MLAVEDTEYHRVCTGYDYEVERREMSFDMFDTHSQECTDENVASWNQGRHQLHHRERTPEHIVTHNEHRHRYSTGTGRERFFSIQSPIGRKAQVMLWCNRVSREAEKCST